VHGSAAQPGSCAARPSPCNGRWAGQLELAYYGKPDDPREETAEELKFREFFEGPQRTPEQIRMFEAARGDIERITNIRPIPIINFRRNGEPT
jgi:hypothetical protein